VNLRRPRTGRTVPGVGFEPTRPCGLGGLSPLRLPVSPPGPGLSHVMGETRGGATLAVEPSLAVSFSRSEVPTPCRSLTASAPARQPAVIHGATIVTFCGVETPPNVAAVSVYVPGVPGVHLMVVEDLVAQVVSQNDLLPASNGWYMP
jgi:hypothetical protein